MSPFVSLIITQVKPALPRLFLVCILSFIYIGLQILNPWPFKILIDNVFGNELLDLETLPFQVTAPALAKEQLALFCVVLMFSVYFFSAIVSYLKNYLLERTNLTLINRFSQTTFKNLESFNLGYFQQQDVGDYVYRLGADTSAIGSILESGFLPLLTSGVYLVGISWLLWQINPSLTLLTLITLPILALGLQYYNRQIDHYSQLSETRYSHLYSYLQQALSQLKAIQAFRQEQAQLSRYQGKLTASLSADFALNRTSLRLALFTGVVVALMYALVTSAGIYAVFAGILTPGLVIVFIFYLDNLSQPVVDITDALASLRVDWVRLKRLKDIFNPHHHTPDTGTLTRIPHFTIEMRQVSLESPTHQPILHQISCVFPANRLTFIIGMSGSGKTSLTNLIPRLMLEPHSGQILLGGHPLTQYSLATLRQHIALVPQETALLNDSIEEIIAFGLPQASTQTIRTAAQLAVADEFITRHPEGYRFKVGERGEFLSGGQRQRLCLARAYLKNAPILILDEVFSAQDSKTQAKMLQHLRRYAEHRNVIAITNSLEVIEPHDNVLMLHQGGLAYSGPYQGIIDSPLINQLAKPPSGVN